MSKKSKRHAPRIPLAASGGIRAQARRNSVSRAWWGQRWIHALEAMHPGARLGRGRSYAISGQVTRLSLSPGLLEATVQGGRTKPYAISIRFALPAPEAIARISARLAGAPMVLARLLVRELPAKVAEWFEEEGAPLFPSPEGDMEATCDCPDWSRTCKHVAAAYLLFGEAMEQNPALLLRLRGIELPELSWEAPPDAETAPAAQEGWSGIPPAPVIDAAGAPQPGQGETAPLARRLGPPPFWRGIDRFEDYVGNVCQRAAPAGWRAWTGESEPPPPTATATPTYRPYKGPLRIERI